MQTKTRLLLIQRICHKAPKGYNWILLALLVEVVGVVLVMFGWLNMTENGGYGGLASVAVGLALFVPASFYIDEASGYLGVLRRRKRYTLDEWQQRERSEVFWRAYYILYGYSMLGFFSISAGQDSFNLTSQIMAQLARAFFFGGVLLLSLAPHLVIILSKRYRKLFVTDNPETRGA